MDIKFAEVIYANSDECAIYENYSGSGMFENTTTGIVCDSIEEFVKACVDATLDEPEIMEEFLGEFLFENIRCDSMGFDTIFY